MSAHRNVREVPIPDRLFLMEKRIKELEEYISRYVAGSMQDYDPEANRVMNSPLAQKLRGA